ncbi:MAG: T9SS type A sorting domain-containing protein [Candidatus Marinimicrobia bacterium]|jgi:hypothetical protein|nr:T9SS type A sorting domain-containing protein [Candidatus Neomarinimicrobiota bacterium]MDX9777352.1 T9SS type A sorting domain-containing protein [bacterium]
MKRVVALLLIAAVALFAAVAPQSDTMVKAGELKSKLPQAVIKSAPLVMEELSLVRKPEMTMSKAPALAVDTNAVTIVYFEDFEAGAPGWTQFDGTAPDPRGEWHLLDAFATGDSLWWCADLIEEGYLSHWMVALETPAVALSGPDSIMTFDLEIYTEGPGGEPAGYDGWDGGNVQISTDDGANWSVLPVSGVPYNCSSLYSFGYEFGMGPGIPGWGGVHTGEVTVNLAEYIGQTVKIRFVLATDPAYDVTDDATLWGMFVDSIHVAGVAEFNGSVNDGLVSYAVNAAMGAYWTVYETTDSIPSPTHVARNYDGDTTYAVLLEDYFVSPSITLPNEPATLIYCNFEFRPNFYDETGEFPDVDFWRLEVSPDDGNTWYAISNPTGDPTLPNYVYSQGSEYWYDFQWAYGELCDLTPHAGKTVKFRFYFHSDGDLPSGDGLMIDDFVVYTQPDLPVPQNVTAELNGDGNVVIGWDNMDGTYQLSKDFMATTPGSETIGAYYGPARTFFGNDSTVGFGLGQSYSTGGKDITFTELDYVLYNLNPNSDSVSVALFGIDSILNVLYWSDNFVPTLGAYDAVDISAEDITWNGDFWVMLFWETSANFPATYIDDGTGVKIYYPGVGFYSDNSSSVPFGAAGYGEVTYSGLQYSVYRRETSKTTLELLAQNLSSNSFVDETASPLVEYEYYVVCSSGDFEGQLSDGAAIFVMPADVEEIAHDDGEVDDIFELAMDTVLVVKVTPGSYPAKLEAVRFFGAWEGDAYKIKVYADDNGMPGSSWLKIEPPVTCIEGWNTFKPTNPMTATGSGIVLEEGQSIWVGVKGATPGEYPAWLGLDANSTYSGLATMQAPGGGWTSIVPYKVGNPMIRAYFDIDIDVTANEEIIPAKYMLAQNYPNPFNPVTTIHFELKETGMTSIDVFDITGRHVRTLINTNLNAGSYDLKFDASALSSGVYFYRMSSGNFTDIKKMSLLK